MKTLFTQVLLSISFFALISFSTQRRQAQDAALKVHVKNLHQTKGDLYFAIYKEEKGFRNPEKAYLRKVVPIKDKNPIVGFENLPSGSYAIAIFQDLNGNGKIDLNWAGIPTEPYGFSNNPKIMFGPPSFSETALSLSGTGKEIEVLLH